jgi:hypothetical protein
MSSAPRVKETLPSQGLERVRPTAAEPDWLGYLREVCELLWPPPTVVTLDSSRPGPAAWAGVFRRSGWAAEQPVSSEFALIPGIHRPPLLVPTNRRTAAAALRHHSGPRSSAAWLGVKALSLGLAGGLGGSVLDARVHMSGPAGADTIEEHLKAVMSRDISVSMYLGPARANRKPVLQLLADGGETVGFAKVGINPLTCELVRAEHDSLVHLARAGIKEIRIPRVLHHGRWESLEILVLEALPAWLPPRPLSASQLAPAMAELAQVGGLRREPLADSQYFRRLRSRLTAVDRGPEQGALMEALDRLAAQANGEMLAFGSWHGDWSPWNMASTSRGLFVWDWERFTGGVPLGFDALHYALQAAVTTGHRKPATAARRCPQTAPRQLAAFGVDARQARLTAILYLADLATRHLADRQAEAGSWLGSPGAWLIPAIAGEVSRL